jgi:ketosteroid isomerase-like protein
MKTLVLALSLASALGLPPTPARQAADPTAQILALERNALDALQTGNIEPYLAILDADISYYHVMTAERLDGVAAVKALVEPYRGRGLFDRYEMLQPRVQVSGDTAVLTYTLVQYLGSAATRYHGTQVYQRKATGWKIVHAHWSQAPAGR